MTVPAAAAAGPAHSSPVRGHLRVRVNGLPAPQGSKRPVRLGNGKMGMVESSKAAGPWREAVRGEVQRALAAAVPLGQAVIETAVPGTPVHVTLVFVMPRPAGHYRTGRNDHLLRDGAPARPCGTPDLDKLVRSTLDGLVMGGALADDAQVTTLDAAKVYAGRGEAPGAIIAMAADNSAGER